MPAPPASDAPTEEAVFACATHVFLQTPQAAKCLEALRRAFDVVTLRHLLVFLAFVRTAHYWTRMYPELELEDDIKGLFAVQEALAKCVLNDPVPSDQGPQGGVMPNRNSSASPWAAELSGGLPDGVLAMAAGGRAAAAAMAEFSTTMYVSAAGSHGRPARRLGRTG